MARRLSRRSVLGTSGALVLAAGCLGGNPGRGGDDEEDSRPTPDHVIWEVEFHEQVPEARERSYPPDHELFDGFEPLEELLGQIEDADDLSAGDRFQTGLYPYGTTETEELLGIWDEIVAEDGYPDVFVEYEELYFLFRHMEGRDAI